MAHGKIKEGNEKLTTSISTHAKALLKKQDPGGRKWGKILSALVVEKFTPNMPIQNCTPEGEKNQ